MKTKLLSSPLLTLVLILGLFSTSCDTLKASEKSNIKKLDNTSVTKEDHNCLNENSNNTDPQIQTQEQVKESSIIAETNTIENNEANKLLEEAEKLMSALNTVKEKLIQKLIVDKLVLVSDLEKKISTIKEDLNNKNQTDLKSVAESLKAISEEVENVKKSLDDQLSKYKTNTKKPFAAKLSKDKRKEIEKNTKMSYSDPKGMYRYSDESGDSIASGIVA
jgi:hypothetical protein